MSALGQMAVIGLYVDDIVVACKSDERFKQIKRDLCLKFVVKDNEELRHLLCIPIARNYDSGDIWVDQPLYIEKVLRKLGMQDAKFVSTPVDVSQKLMKSVDGEALFNQSDNQSVVGCLLYLSMSIRAYISYTVSNVAKYSSKPTQTHWNAILR